jgi:TatD DNase family protein
VLIDTHCHLHDKDFFTDEQAKEMLARAEKNDIKKIICIGTSHQDSLATKNFASKNSQVFWTYGIHPSETSNPNFSFTPNLSLPQDPKLVAIGEVGLDYHFDGYNKKAQTKLFEQMLQLAATYNLPVSFHIREAFPDFFAVINNFSKVRGVVHSFTDNKKVLKRILNETNFYVGVNGLATYSTLPTPPLDRILLETDAPFLAPLPHRKETNEPSYILEIANWLSVKLEKDLKTIKKETTRNAKALFNI